jgi:hypothetical protein
MMSVMPNPDPEPPAQDRPAPVRRTPRKDVFGDVLPDTTADEREPAGPGSDEESWYRENRPPHHDRF